MSQEMKLFVGTTRARRMMIPFEDINSTWLTVGSYLRDISVLLLMGYEKRISTNIIESALKLAIKVGLVCERKNPQELCEELLAEKKDIIYAIYLATKPGVKPQYMDAAIKVASRLKLLPPSDLYMLSCKPNYDVIAKNLGCSGKAIWLSSMGGYRESVAGILGSDIPKDLASHIEPKYAALKDACTRPFPKSKVKVIADYDGCTSAASQYAAKYFNSFQVMYEWFRRVVYRRPCGSSPKINSELEAHRLRTMLITFKSCMKGKRAVIFIDDKAKYLNKLLECCYRDGSLRLPENTFVYFIQYAYLGIKFQRECKLKLCEVVLSPDGDSSQKKFSGASEMLSNIVGFFNSRFYSTLFKAGVASAIISETIRRFVFENCDGVEPSGIMEDGQASSRLRGCFLPFLDGLDRARWLREGRRLTSKKRDVSSVCHSGGNGSGGSDDSSVLSSPVLPKRVRV